jgi:shikimate 5-dehydrogenase
MANKDTIYLGLLGNPVAHSYSPLMHNAVFNKLNIKGFYLPVVMAFCLALRNVQANLLASLSRVRLLNTGCMDG